MQTFGTPLCRLCSSPIQCRRTAKRMHRIRIAILVPIFASMLPPPLHCCTSYRDPATVRNRIKCCALWRPQSDWSNGRPLPPCTFHANRLDACNRPSAHKHTSPCPIASICHTNREKNENCQWFNDLHRATVAQLTFGTDLFAVRWSMADRRSLR